MKQNNPKIIYRLKKQIILCKEIKENKVNIKIIARKMLKTFTFEILIFLTFILCSCFKRALGISKLYFVEVELSNNYN